MAKKKVESIAATDPGDELCKCGHLRREHAPMLLDDKTKIKPAPDAEGRGPCCIYRVPAQNNRCWCEQFTFATKFI